MLGPTLLTLGYIHSTENKLHPAVTAFVRGITITLLTYFIARNQHLDLTFKSSHNFKWQILRNSTMLVHTFVYAWVQYYLPLPIAITLNSTSSIFIAIFDKIIYKVDLNTKQIIWLKIAFIGVILTVNGNYISYLVFG